MKKEFKNKFLISYKKLFSLFVSIYIILSYASKISTIQDIVPSSTILSGTVLVVPLILMLLRSTTGKPLGISPKQITILFWYVLILLSILVMLNINARKPIFSAIRAVWSSIELWVTSVLFFQLLVATDMEKGRSNPILSQLLFATMLILVLGQITIPEWKWGVGIRLSGGTNPNQAGFFAFFSLVWAHYWSLKTGDWSRLHIMLYVVSTLVMFWSLSRTVLAGWVTLYTLVYSHRVLNYFYKILIDPLYKYKKLLPLMGFVALFLMAGLWVPQTNYLQTAADFQKVEQRLSGSEGLESRMDAWGRLWPYFEDAPATGSAGWWNATNLLPWQGIGSGATSPHNLYVRLLSEVGLIGLAAVLLYPAAVALGLLANAFALPVTSRRTYIYLYLFGSIFSVFLGQLFEDRYMVGIFNNGNIIVIFFITAGLYEIVKNTNK